MVQMIFKRKEVIHHEWCNLSTHLGRQVVNHPDCLVPCHVCAAVLSSGLVMLLVMELVGILE